MIGDYLEQYTFEYLMEQALARVPDTIDKREGSIIYDALAPACYELSEYYMALKRILQDTYAETASGQYLDLRVAEQGISRFQATYAVKKGEFTDTSDNPAMIPIGSRFSTISDYMPINYIVTEVYKDEFDESVPGMYLLRCEELGSKGNSYSGNLIPIDNIPNLKTAILTDLIVPAQDVEEDEDLRIRYFAKINEKAFGGNVAQYKSEIKNIDGVGDVQIYPVWNGGGTVKCSIIDSNYNKLSPEFVSIIQNIIDPENSDGDSGLGLGIAPIGHKVTITTPTEKVIKVEADVVLTSGFTLVQTKPLIESAINEYLLELRKQWGIEDELNNYSLAVYLSRISAAILSVTGVANVTNVKLNDDTQDIILTQNSSLQELPILGEVIINE